MDELSKFAPRQIISQYEPRKVFKAFALTHENQTVAPLKPGKNLRNPVETFMLPVIVDLPYIGESWCVM